MTSATAVPDPLSPEPASSAEKRVVWLIFAVQLVNILEFMMVMPLGPDFAKDLGLSAAKLGWVGAAYTGAAAIAGLLSSTFIERYDRRRALAVTLCGLVLATLIGGLAYDTVTMILARILAGAFGGPATAIALAIVTDQVPLSRRGRAMGVVMSAFAVASVVGVPLGLEIARLAGWRMVFFLVALFGAALAAFCIVNLPAMREHIQPVGTLKIYP